MADVVGMQISKGCKQLLHNLGCLFLIKVLVLDDIVEQFSALAVSIVNISDYHSGV